MTFKNGEGQEQLHAVLKQEAALLAGTAGPDADHQYKILKGKLTSTKDATSVAFELIVDGVHSSFDLKLVDGALRGDAVVEGEDGKRHLATVELRPVK
jgi:hypothetical protein